MTVRRTYVMLFVQDMDRAVRFYRDVFGLMERMTSPDWSELAYGDAIVALHPGKPAGEVEGAPILGFSVDDLEASISVVTEAGGRALNEPFSPSGEGVTLVDILDSEGNHLMLSRETRR